MENIEVPEGMNPEVLKHLMDPQNYGKLDDANGIGVAHDEKTGEFVIFYIKTDNDAINDVRFATNGCQDTVVVGSMFTEIIKGKSIEDGKKAIALLEQKIGIVTPQQRICAEMVFNAFIASLINLENLKRGEKEEMHVINSEESCEIEAKDENE
ncbi:iron-sulfur cluster assembly scaffold protein [Sulfurimonas sp. HSL3-7]|uniref:iron-sulfur cluster assembly scaffold protein n=1 Tax=Sulfonitrofixus jiaomeiensis TaxID=3131938 RepID=UPI0031F7C041